MLNQELLRLNGELEQALEDRDGELIRARNGLVLALAKIVEHRSAETGSHLLRLQRYCRVLAEEAAATPAFAALLDENFIRTLEDSAPLHDIGKAALPDHVLNKPGPLDANERLVMQTHTTIGADTLREVARRHPFATGFLHMAIDIARSHHERWDGTGYPDRLAAASIPLARAAAGARRRVRRPAQQAHLQAGAVAHDGGDDDDRGIAGPVRPGAPGSVPQIRRPVRPHLPRIDGLK